MTRENFAKSRFKHSEEIIYTSPNKIINARVIECMLVAIDFENDLLRLIPFDQDEYGELEFWARVEYCEKAPHKLKARK